MNFELCGLYHRKRYVRTINRQLHKHSSSVQSPMMGNTATTSSSKDSYLTTQRGAIIIRSRSKPRAKYTRYKKVIVSRKLGVSELASEDKTFNCVILHFSTYGAPRMCSVDWAVIRQTREFEHHGVPIKNDGIMFLLRITCTVRGGP